MYGNLHFSHTIFFFDSAMLSAAQIQYMNDYCVVVIVGVRGGALFPHNTVYSRVALLHKDAPRDTTPLAP